MLTYLKKILLDLTSDDRFSEIFTGSIWAISARIIAAGLGLITSIIIARGYGADIMGIVAVTTSFLSLITVFTVLGTNTSILRLIPEHMIKYSTTSAFKLYRKIQYIVITTSLVLGTLFFLNTDFVADKVFAKSHLSFYFGLAAVFVVFESLAILNTQAIRGLRLIRVFAFMQLMPHGFTLLLLLLFGLVWPTISAPVYAILGGFALTAITGQMIIQNAFKQNMKPGEFVHHMSTKDILSISLPMLMTSAMSFIIGQTGVIILGMFRQEADVGYYAVAVKLATLTTFVLTAINSMAAPKFSELFHSGKIDKLFYVARKSTRLIFWTTTPILAFLILLGKPLLTVLYGPEFSVAYWAMFFLVLGQFVNSISGSTGYFMNMTGHQNIFRNVMLITALLNITLNLVLIPQFGIIGAALTAMVCYVLWNSLLLLYIKSKYGRTIGYFPFLV